MPSSLTDVAELSDRQRELLASWLPGARVVADHSWGLVSTRVLQVVCGAEVFAVKAAAPDDGHLPRELRAHREWLGPWAAAGVGPVLVHADEAARLLVTRWLPGRLVLGTPHQDDPVTYRQAGALAAALHAQESVLDPSWTRATRDRALRHLEGPHRIEAPVERAVRDELDRWGEEPAVLVPTHGDWQPRNWLVDETDAGPVVRVIDLGRAALRPVEEDFARLAVQDFRRDPRLEAAYLSGYGGDPRSEPTWSRKLLSEAVGTAVWAYQVGDEDFEAQGHRMLRDALAR